jgi:hypothetical protein
MTAATVASPANSIYFGNKLSNVALTPQTLHHDWLTAETDEANDIVGFGYLPTGVTVIGCLNVVADLDSGSALRQTIKIGSTTVVATNSLASAGGQESYWITPLVLTAPAEVTVTTTTGATGHQNGRQYLTFLYYSAQ